MELSHASPLGGSSRAQWCEKKTLKQKAKDFLPIEKLEKSVRDTVDLKNNCVHLHIVEGLKPTQVVPNRKKNYLFNSTDSNCVSCPPRIGPSRMSSLSKISTSQFSKINALISSHPGGFTPGKPRAFAPIHLQIPRTQGQYSSTKSYHCLSPEKHNFKGLPNCNVVSCIIFNKSFTINI